MLTATTPCTLTHGNAPPCHIAPLARTITRTRIQCHVSEHAGLKEHAPICPNLQIIRNQLATSSTNKSSAHSSLQEMQGIPHAASQRCDTFSPSWHLTSLLRQTSTILSLGRAIADTSKTLARPDICADMTYPSCSKRSCTWFTKDHMQVSLGTLPGSDAVLLTRFLLEVSVLSCKPMCHHSNSWVADHCVNVLGHPHST